MNMFKKKHKNECASFNSNWKKSSGSFIRKPAKGWIHPDHLIETSSVIYETQYIGCVKVLESVKTIPFEQRGLLVREAISRCCIASKLFDFKKKKKCEDATINDRLGDINLDHSGALTSTTFSKSFIKTYILRSGDNILDHSIQCISFASIGENEYKSFIGYISKDKSVERACFVFDCKGDIADDIILTIGQAFELKYKEFLNSSSTIQPVVKRFTDLDHDTEDGSGSNYYDIGASNCDDQPEYAELFSEDNSTIVVKSAPGYDSLHRNDNMQGNEPAAPEANVNFSPCPHYDGKDVEFGAIYDNPISSADITKHHSNHTPDKVVSLDEEDYLEPLDPPLEKTSTYCQLLESDVKSNSNRDLEVVSDSYAELSTSLQESWFHGKISRELAEKYVKNDGDFLVRESTSSKDQFVLSGMCNGSHRHILLIDPEGKVQTRDHIFTDVPELIKYHYSQDIPINSGSSHVYLKREISKMYVHS